MLAMSFLVVSMASVLAQVDKDQIQRKFETEYGVTVLRIREISDNGKPVFAVTVMNPGGNFNEAYQVNTVAVDPETGELISQYRSKTNGIQHAAPPIGHRTHPLTQDTE